MSKNCFIPFKKDISSICLPSKFTFPFYYQPHVLSVLASEQLQEYLETQTDWVHNFGIHEKIDGTNIGKMFGVLVVEKPNGELGFLAAFSGKLANRNDHPYFVPPIFNMLTSDGFFKKGERIIDAINKKVEELEQSDELKNAREKQANVRKRAELSLNAFRDEMKRAKKDRKHQREVAEKSLLPHELLVLKEKLKNESLKKQYDYKVLRSEWDIRLEKADLNLLAILDEINALKEERKTKSAALQQLIFDEYNFLNMKGETLNVCAIFENTANKVPPAGSGECAAPKLFQFAFSNNLKPICMAEFWWGASPKSEVRKHKNYYPSCRGKCEPILGYMLQGIEMDDNPMLTYSAGNAVIEKLFEDEFLLVINKPHEFLSVPGKNSSDSVYTAIKNEYPQATGPLIVHRLDMSTSGIMLIAKNKEVHKHLQAQFLARSIKKRYVAVLDGLLETDGGEIELPLRVDLDDRPRQLVCYEYGKHAKTLWKLIETKDGKSKVHFYPITGRTHQLRVHAAHPKGLNCPIVGDDLYGKMQNRLHLHADYIKFKHPISKQEIEIQVDAGF